MAYWENSFLPQRCGSHNVCGAWVLHLERAFLCGGKKCLCPNPEYRKHAARDCSDWLLLFLFVLHGKNCLTVLRLSAV